MLFSCTIVEDVTVTVNDQCNGFTTISWILRGDAVMLSDVNFTITIDIMGMPSFTDDIIAGDCDNMTSCGQYLTQFDYTSEIVGLANNTLYDVSITTSINQTNSMHVLQTPVVTITANTTISGN